MRLGFDVGGGTDGAAWPFPWTTTLVGSPTAVDVHSGLLRVSMPASASTEAGLMYQQPVNPYQWEMGFRCTPSVAWGSANTCRIFFGITPSNAFNINGHHSDSLYANFQSVIGAGSSFQEVGTTTTELTPNYSGMSLPTTTVKAMVRARFVYPYMLLKGWAETSVEPAWYQETISAVKATISMVNKPMFPFLIVNNENAVARDYSFDKFYFDDLQPRHASLNLA